MQDGRAGDVTRLLLAWGSGDARALDALAPLVYDELRRLARFHMRREKTDHTLQTTALVHEVYLRMVNHHATSYRDRIHFFGAAAGIMRRVLIDHARQRLTAKRGGQAIQVAFDQALEVPDPHAGLLRVHECLNQLSALDERLGRIVELRFFGGLSIEETALAVGISPMTVKREWAVARAWLFREMSGREHRSLPSSPLQRFNKAS
jgi:RNA polymerase sigma factor (TIGR02999 family)